jgi:hypothetical protein
MVSANANIISTRWGTSKMMNDDGTWPSKARLVARGNENKEKDRFPSCLICGSAPCSGVTGLCNALLRMRHLSISWAECSVVISCGKVDYDKSG